MNSSLKARLILDVAGICALAALLITFSLVGVIPILRAESAAQELAVRRVRQGQLIHGAEAVLRAQATKLTGLKEELARCKVRLGYPGEINGKLEKISLLADARSLRILSLNPHPSVPNGEFDYTPIRLAGTGTYHDFAMFAHDVHDVIPDVSVSSLILESKPDNPREPPTFQVELRWYTRHPALAGDTPSRVPRGPEHGKASVADIR